MKDIICIRCGAQYDEQDIVNAIDCPTCHTHSIPMHRKDNLTVNVNHHELRILCIWAENWAHYCDNKEENKAVPNYEKLSDCVYGIARRLEEQIDPKKVSLTLRGELKQLKEEMGSKVGPIELHRDGTKEIIE